MLRFTHFVLSFLVILVPSLDLNAQVNVQIFNSNDFYALCCKFPNTTGYQIILLPPNNDIELTNLINELELAAIHNPTDCTSVDNPYAAVAVFQHPNMVQKVTLQAAPGNNEPMFTFN